MEVRHTRLGRLLLPSLSDCLFVSLLVLLFGTGGRWATLLADGDSGWHIRTGEFILDHRQWPFRDLFSFSKAGQPWYAWEWLSDLLFAAVFRALGLKGLVLASGLVITASAILVLRHMIWRGANAFLAVALTMLSVGAASIHYLARPHVFTLLLWAVSLLVLERDRRQPTRAVWLLVPLAALWTNLHGGWVALPASLAVLAAGSVIEALLNPPAAGRWFRTRRYSALALASSLASLANPYGPRLHLHIVRYLRSDWIRNMVDEFQSPKFRSENSLHFEIILFAGLMLAAWLLSRREVAEALLLLAWAHAALVSARHVPLFVILAAPPVAAAASLLWTRWTEGKPAKSVLVILDRVATDLAPGFRHTSLWIALGVLALVLFTPAAHWPRNFPQQKFPVELIERQRGRLEGSRVFTSDQWGDYLIYRFYPRQKVFIDGRSDFYGPEIGKQYLRTVQAHPDWRKVLDGYSMNLVVAHPEWPLANLLQQVPGWRLVDRDSTALLFERTGP